MSSLSTQDRQLAEKAAASGVVARIVSRARLSSA
jgi:hypothetical protein